SRPSVRFRAASLHSRGNAAAAASTAARSPRSAGRPRPPLRLRAAERASSRLLTGDAPVPGPSAPLHRIVIVGGGAGGLELATRLGNTLARRRRAEVTLIDKARAHLWKPLLHEVAAGS